MPKAQLQRTLAAIVLVASTPFAGAATLAASYSFQGTLAADQPGVAALVAIDPFAVTPLANGFESAVVFGQTQQVYRWHGDGTSPTTQAGLVLDATGLVSYDNYSVELTFEFLEQAQFGGGWRRIMDTQNRQSDNGFYVAPGNFLQVYPDVTGSTAFTTPGFHTVVLTNYVVGGVREVKGYLDGVLQISSDTDQLNLDNANNPGHLLNFFVDNLASSAQQEFADGRIAYLRLYDGVVIPQTPEPGEWALLLPGLAWVGWRARARRARG